MSSGVRSIAVLVARHGFVGAAGRWGHSGSVGRWCDSVAILAFVDASRVVG